MVVKEEEKCVGNAEETVDDGLEADTLNMLCMRYVVVVVMVKVRMTVIDEASRQQLISDHVAKCGYTNSNGDNVECICQAPPISIQIAVFNGGEFHSREPCRCHTE